MSTATLQELSHDPLALVSRVEAGERIVVIRGNKPVLELRPVKKRNSKKRPIGLAEGEFTVPDDFNDPLPPEVLKRFTGQ
jgi:antitoxin (DNA-binding transcriptional repressor) of toxin-antitoxin stability system